MDAPHPDASWQAIAIELLRRRAGGAPRMTTERLAEAGAPALPDLIRKRIDSLYFVTCDIAHPRQRVYQALWGAQRQEANAVIQELLALGVTPLVFKGVEIGARYDGTRAVCERSDVDLLVPQEALWKAKKVLYRRGYEPGYYQPGTRTWMPVDHVAQARHESQAYEIVPFRKPVVVEGLDDAALVEARRHKYFHVQDGVVVAFIKLDIHHNILFGFDCRTFVERSIPSALGHGRALCPADHLWFSIHRYYGEAAGGHKRGLRALVWIASMVADPEVDWSLLVRTAVERRAAAPCFYWLAFFRHLGATRISSAVVAELGRHRARGARDWGWQLERWFELEEALPDGLIEAGPTAPQAMRADSLIADS